MAAIFLAAFADKLRKNREPSDYKHVVLGLILLKHISNAFEATASIYRRVASP
jgi:type I restriction enzyme M protein